MSTTQAAGALEARVKTRPQFVVARLPGEASDENFALLLGHQATRGHHESIISFRWLWSNCRFCSKGGRRARPVSRYPLDAVPFAGSTILLGIHAITVSCALSPTCIGAEAWAHAGGVPETIYALDLDSAACCRRRSWNTSVEVS